MHTSETRGKRAYTTPQLKMHGTLEELTKEQEKYYGASDGFTFLGTPITNVS